LYDARGVTTSAGVLVPGALPYYDPTWANDPEVMNWANTAGHGLENFFFGIGLPFTNLLDITSALYTPACVVEGQCLTDRYKAWGEDHGLSPGSNTAGLGAAIGSVATGGGKGKSPVEGDPVSPAFEGDPYHPDKVQKRIDAGRQAWARIPKEVHNTVNGIESGRITQRINSNGPVWFNANGNINSPWYNATIFTGVGSPTTQTRVLVRSDGVVGYVLGHNYNNVIEYPYANLLGQYVPRP
jgi:hypothetical protein